MQKNKSNRNDVVLPTPENKTINSAFLSSTQESKIIENDVVLPTPENKTINSAFLSSTQERKIIENANLSPNIEIATTNSTTIQKNIIEAKASTTVQSNQPKTASSTIQADEIINDPSFSNLNCSETRTKNKGERIWELDVLKAFAFLFMVLDHAMFDLAYVFRYIWNANYGSFLYKLTDIGYDYRNSATVDTLRFILCAGIFMFVSGICCVFSRNNLKRGARLAVLAIALSIITYIISIAFNVFAHIKYGILAMLAVSMILGHYLVRLDWTKLIIIGLYALFFSKVFEQIRVNDTFILPFFNFYSPNYISADHYPLLPNIAYFIFGIAFAKIFYKKRKSLLPFNIKPLSKASELISKHLVFLYFAHQVAVFILLYIIGMIFG